jgi:hypothetical protein
MGIRDLLENHFLAIFEAVFVTGIVADIVAILSTGLVTYSVVAGSIGVFYTSDAAVTNIVKNESF